MDGFVEHVVEEDGRSNLQDEKMEVMPINIFTRMNLNVVLTVEAESKKMMRMDIRLIMSMVDKLINGDDIYIMMGVCVFVTKNDHFLLGVSCNPLNPP